MAYIYQGTSWSIGGTPPAGVGGPLAHFGKGISGSHNRYEGDASPTRPDLYEEGNDYMTKANQAQQLLDASPGDKITINTLTAFRQQRFKTQIANNPYVSPRSSIKHGERRTNCFATVLQRSLFWFACPARRLHVHLPIHGEPL